MQGIDLANPVLFQCAWPSSSSHSPGAESDVPAAPFGPVPPPPGPPSASPQRGSPAVWPHPHPTCAFPPPCLRPPSSRAAKASASPWLWSVSPSNPPTSSWADDSQSIPFCPLPTKSRSNPPRPGRAPATYPASTAPRRRLHSPSLKPPACPAGALLPPAPTPSLFSPIFTSWFNASSNLKPPLILLSGTNLAFLGALLCAFVQPLCPVSHPAL